jgi:hypothetical protein
MRASAEAGVAELPRRVQRRVQRITVESGEATTVRSPRGTLRAGRIERIGGVGCIAEG